MDLPKDWERLSTPCGRPIYRDGSANSFHFEPPPTPARAAAPGAPSTSACLDELAAMFPSWDGAALAAVLEANGGDADATVTRLLAWTAEETAEGAARARVEDRGGEEAALATALAASRIGDGDHP